MPTEPERRARDGQGGVDALYELAIKCGASRHEAAGHAHNANKALGYLKDSVDVLSRKLNAALQAQQTGTVSAAEVFRIAGGDIECSPTPTAQQAIECLRDLRKCYDEALAQQPGAQAVAWHTDDHLTDKSATTYDPVIADRWRAKGWPVTPHYLRPQPPSIPEPSEEDVEAAIAAYGRSAGFGDSPGRMLAALTTYTARLRERIGGDR